MQRYLTYKFFFSGGYLHCYLCAILFVLSGLFYNMFVCFIRLELSYSKILLLIIMFTIVSNRFFAESNDACRNGDADTSGCCICSESVTSTSSNNCTCCSSINTAVIATYCYTVFHVVKYVWCQDTVSCHFHCHCFISSSCLECQKSVCMPVWPMSLTRKSDAWRANVPSLLFDDTVVTVPELICHWIIRVPSKKL